MYLHFDFICSRQEGSSIYNNAKTLEEFFDQMLEKWLPIYGLDDSLRLHAFDFNEDDDDLGEPPHKRSKKSSSD
jgi:hypothetical protein